VKERDEAWAEAVLRQVVDRSVQDRDALPGSVVKLVKEAIRILRKRRKNRVAA
jgi:hypothetical protein